MIVKMSDILKAKVQRAPVTGERYVVVRVREQVLRVPLDR